MTEGVTTLVDYAGWLIRRFDCPEDDRPDWRRKYLIERKDGMKSLGWMSEKEYQIFKVIMEMADMKENGVKE